MTSAPVGAPDPRAGRQGRDLRLDFFRGLGLLFIFVDHIPDNWVSYLTLANIVFCDAAEVFVFISGISVAMVFGRFADREGYVFAGAQALRRTWTLYVAHVFLLVIFTAQVSYAAQRWNNPMFVEEMNIAGFLEDPGLAILKALSLQLQPMFMGILPLYIVLLLALSFALPLLRRALDLCLVLGFGLWLFVQLTGVNLRTYPDGWWFHNPLAWQFLFVIGAAIGVSQYLGGTRAMLLRAPPVWISAALLAASIAGKLALTFGTMLGLMPEAIADVIWRYGDKSSLGILRLASFLALVHVVAVAVPVTARWLSARAAAPIVRCGQHSLEVFCFGIFLSVAAHALLVEFGRTRAHEALVSLGGCVILILVARFLDWTKRREGAPRAPRLATGGDE
jgi:hypothetical protein